jgi:hypothetical protein
VAKLTLESNDISKIKIILLIEVIISFTKKISKYIRMKQIIITTVLLLSNIAPITAMEPQPISNNLEAWHQAGLSSVAAYKEYKQQETNPLPEISFHFAYQIYQVMNQSSSRTQKKHLLKSLQDIFNTKTSQ